MESNKLILKNTIYLYARSILILLLSLYTSRVLLHALGVDDYGLYSVIGGVVAMFGFLNSAMVNAIQRYMNFALGKSDEDYLSKVFYSSLLIQIIISLIILICAEGIGVWFVNKKMNIPTERLTAANIVYQLSILSFIVKIFQAPFTSIIVSYEKMNFFAIQGVLEAVLLLVIIFLLDVLPGDPLILYALLLCGVSAIIFSLNVIYAKKVYRRMTFHISVEKSIVKDMLSFSGWNLLGSFSGVLKSQGINVLLNMFFNVAINAARGIAYQVLSGVMTMIGNFQTAIKPQLIQSYAEGNLNRYFSLVFKGSKITYFLMWIFVLPLVLAINQVLTIWLGDGAVPDYSAVFTILVLLTGLIDSYATTISLAIYAIGNIKYYQIVVSAIIISILPISYLCLRNGAAPESTMYISLMISIVAQIVRVIIWRTLINFSLLKYLKAVVLPTIFVSVISYFICRALIEQMTFITNNISYVISVVLLSLSVNFLLITFVGLNKEERQSLFCKI